MLSCSHVETSICLCYEIKQCRGMGFLFQSELTCKGTNAVIRNSLALFYLVCFSLSHYRRLQTSKCPVITSDHFICSLIYRRKLSSLQPYINSNRKKCICVVLLCLPLIMQHILSFCVKAAPGCEILKLCLEQILVFLSALTPLCEWNTRSDFSHIDRAAQPH